MPQGANAWLGRTRVAGKRDVAGMFAEPRAAYAVLTAPSRGTGLRAMVVRAEDV